MKKSYRVIAAITLASFFLTTILSDVAISQPLDRQINSDKLATPSNLDDIVMSDAQIMNNIAFALYGRLAFLNYQEKEIDTETLKVLLLKQKVRGDIRFERQKMEFYFEGLEAVSLSYFVVKCRVEIKNEPITRYALFSPFRGDDDGFPIEVYTPEQIEEAYPGLGQLAARQSSSGRSEYEQEALDNYASGFVHLCETHKREEPAESIRLAEGIFGAYKAEFIGGLNRDNAERLKRDIIGIIKNIPLDKVEEVIVGALSILDEAGLTGEEESIVKGLRAILKASLERTDAGAAQLTIASVPFDSLLDKYKALFESLCHKGQRPERSIAMAEIIFKANLATLRGDVDESSRQLFIKNLRDVCKGASSEDIETTFTILANAGVNHSYWHLFDETSVMNRLFTILNAKRPKLEDITEGFGVFGPRGGGRDESYYPGLWDEVPDEPRSSASGMEFTFQFSPTEIVFTGNHILAQKPEYSRETPYHIIDGFNTATGVPIDDRLRKLLHLHPEKTLSHSRLAVINDAKRLTVWNIAVGKPMDGLVELDVKYGYRLLRNHLIVCDSEGRLTVYDLRTGKSANGLAGLNASCGFSIDGRYLAVNGRNNRLTVYDINTGEAFAGLKGLDAAGGFQIAGAYLAIRDSSNELRVYDIRTGSLIIKGLRDTNEYHGFELSGKYLAVRDHQNNLTVYDLITRLPAGGLVRISDVQRCELEGSCVALLFPHGKVTVYDVVKDEPMEGLVELNAYNGFKMSARHILVHTINNEMLVYDLRTGRVIPGLRCLPDLGDIDAPVTFTMNENGRTTIRIYNEADETPVLRSSYTPRQSASGNRASAESARKRIQDYLVGRTDIDVSVTAKALMVPAKAVIRELRRAGFVHREGNSYYKLVYDGHTYDLRKKRGDEEVRESRESASGKVEPTSRDYSVEVAALIGQGQPHAAADIVNGLYRQWKELRQEDIESEASRMAGKSLREACLAIIKAQPLQRRQILKSERLGSEARRFLFVLGVSLSLSQKDRTGVPRKLLEFLFPLVNPLKIKEAVTLNEAIYLFKEDGMVWKDKDTNEWRIASMEGNYPLGVNELKAIRALLEFSGNLSETPTLANPEAQKTQPPVVLLAVSEAIGMEDLARRDRFTKVYEALKKASPGLAAKLPEVMGRIEGIMPDLGNRDLFDRIKALPVSRQEKEALSLAFEQGTEPIQAENRRFSASGAEDERARKEITDMRELASEVGVNVALPVQNYTIFASYNLLTDEEYEKDQNDYLYRFGLERILTDKQEKMVDWVIGAIESKKLNPKDVIVQLPKDFSDDKYRAELEKLEARGIKFMILNTDGLEKESKEARAEYRRNIYVMMLLARNINKDTLPESSLYRLLRFFIASHLEDFKGKEAAIDKYIDDIKNNNIAGLIKMALSYKPVAPYDSEKLREEYNGVAKALVSA